MIDKRCLPFQPDLVAEVTLSCDRRCPGCYSPTLVTQDDPRQVIEARPELFLLPEVLDRLLGGLDEPALTVALRGGEPSRHPLLAALVEVAARHAQVVWVESHARWVLKEPAWSAGWLETLARTEAVLKISYDRMHALKPATLREITTRLDRSRVAWNVAITEPTEGEFLRARAACPWIPEEYFIFQKKVRNHNELVHPRLGTIDPTGGRADGVTAQPAFLTLAVG